jgi:hypothetical protein
MRESIPKDKAAPEKPPAAAAREHDKPHPSPTAEQRILQLQRLVGNQAVRRMLHPDATHATRATHATTHAHSTHSAQPVGVSRAARPAPDAVRANHSELKLSSPADHSEVEAERIADEVSAIPDAQLQRACACDGGDCPECGSRQQASATHAHVQRSVDDAASIARRADDGVSADDGASVAPSLVQEALSSSGQPLERSVRDFMEPRFGHDFSHVRVHNDARAAESAQSVNALAYTTGHNIVFGAGQYAPETHAGRRLVAHELTHVIQQQSGTARALVQRQPQPMKTGLSFQYSVKLKTALTSEQLLVEFVKQYYQLESDAAAERAIVTGNWGWTGTPKVATEEDAKKGYILLNVTDKNLSAPSAKEKRERGQYFKQLKPEEQAELNGAVDRMFWEKTNYKVNEKLGDSADDQKMAKYWTALRDELLRQRQELDALPPAIKKFLFTENAPKKLEPKDYAAALRIAQRLAQLSAADLADYKSKVGAYTDDWSEFEKSVGRYVTARAERRKEEKDREKIKTRLFGLQGLYKTYKAYRSLQLSNAIMPAVDEYGQSDPMKESVRESLNTTEAELFEGLRRHNFANLAEFEKYIDDYEAAFRKETVRIAFDLLAKYEHVLLEEETKYQNPAAAAALHQSIKQTDARKHYQEAEEHRGTAMRSAAPAGGAGPQPHVAAALGKAAASEQQAEGEVAGAAGAEHPLVKNRSFDRKRLARAGQGDVQAMMLEYIQARRQDIKETRENITNDSELVYKLDELLKASYQTQNVAPDSIYDLIIRDRVKAVHIHEMILNLAIAVFAIVFTVVTLGAGGAIAAGGAVAMAVLGGLQAFHEFRQYEIKSAAFGSELLSDDPSVAWVILAVVGAGFDLAGAYSAIASMKTAVKTFNATGDLIQLEKELRALSAVNEQIRANVLRAAKAEAQYQKAFKGLLGATGQMNMILGGNEFGKLVAVAYYLGKRGVVAFEKFLLELKLKGIIADIEKLSPEDLGFLKKAFEEGLQKSETGLLKIEELSDQIRGVYNATQIEEIAAHGKALGFTDDQIKDFLEMGSIAKPGKQPPKLPLTPDQLKEQMDNWVNVVKPRGFPFLFENAEKFETFKSQLKGLLSKYDVPSGKIYVQGSSLRTAKAKDVDVAIFVSDGDFAKYAERCREGIRTRNAAKPYLVESLLKDLEAQVKDGYISKFLMDRIAGAPKQSFEREVGSLIEGPLGIRTDISVMKSSSKLALYPALEL